MIILYERYKISCNPCLSSEYYIQRTGKDGEVMKELAIRYCKEGYGCGGCIIKAADTKYSLNMNGELIKAMSAASGGFGYGGLCAAVAAAVLLFGFMFDEDTSKRLRTEFMQKFKQRYRTFNCCSMTENCESIISYAADLADCLISREL